MPCSAFSFIPFRDDAVVLVKRILGEASQGEQLDAAAFEAFGLSNTDPATIRWTMNEFQKDGSTAQAAWYAAKLRQLVPSDLESSEVIRRATRMGIKPQREPT